MSVRSSSKPAKALNAGSRRLLLHLSLEGAYARCDPFDESRLTLVAPSRGVPSPVGFSTVDACRSLTDAGLAVWLPPGTESVARLVASRTGLATAARLRAGAQGRDPFAAQHRSLRVVAFGSGETRAEAVVNDAESHLAWLHRRRGRDGQPLINAVSFAAGERLRRDLTIANMLPSATMRWDGLPATSGGGRPDPAAATDAMVAARQRVVRAMRAVGSDFEGLLVDVCGFLKGIEQIERERGWPARSAKIVLDMALVRLAAHYGLSGQARGPDKSKGVRSWSVRDGSSPPG